MCLKCTLKRALFLFYALIAIPYAVLGMSLGELQERDQIDPEFLEAIKTEDVERMQTMVRGRPSLLTHGFCPTGFNEPYLMKNGTNYFSTEATYLAKKNTIPICVAAREGKLRALRFLFENNAPLQDDLSQYSALNSAAVAGQLEAVRWLLSNGADIRRGRGHEALLVAVECGHVDVIRILLSCGVDVRHCVEAIHYAAIRGYLTVVQALIEEYNLDVNVECSPFKTPLQVASKHGHEAVVEYLLRRGADINKTGREGRTSLHDAAIQGHASVVRCLLSRGAGVNTICQDEGFITPLLAALCGNSWHQKGLVVFKELLRHGATLDGQNRDDRVLLHAVINCQGVSILRYLLAEEGFNTQLLDSVSNKTPLAATLGNHIFAELSRLILAFGVPVSADERALLKARQEEYARNPQVSNFLNVRAIIQNRRREIEDALLGEAPRPQATGRLQAVMRRVARSKWLPRVLADAVQSNEARSDMRGEKPAMLQNVPDDVIKRIIEYMVTPDLPELDEVGDDS